METALKAIQKATQRDIRIRLPMPLNLSGLSVVSSGAAYLASPTSNRDSHYLKDRMFAAYPSVDCSPCFRFSRSVLDPTYTILISSHLREALLESNGEIL